MIAALSLERRNPYISIPSAQQHPENQNSAGRQEDSLNYLATAECENHISICEFWGDIKIQPALLRFITLQGLFMGQI
jgi:hypothetical protein